VKTQTGLENKIRDLEREKALLAERKVEPVKEEPKAAAKKPAATPAKSTTSKKSTTKKKK
jgi:hypothetical protein